MKQQILNMGNFGQSKCDFRIGVGIWAENLIFSFSRGVIFVILLLKFHHFWSLELEISTYLVKNTLHFPQTNFIWPYKLFLAIQIRVSGEIMTFPFSQGVILGKNEDIFWKNSDFLCDRIIKCLEICKYSLKPFPWVLEVRIERFNDLWYVPQSPGDAINSATHF